MLLTNWIINRSLDIPRGSLFFFFCRSARFTDRLIMRNASRSLNFSRRFNFFQFSSDSDFSPPQEIKWK